MNTNSETIPHSIVAVVGFVAKDPPDARHLPDRPFRPVMIHFPPHRCCD